MDSKKIAAALEERYPDPPLHLDAPELAKAEDLLGGVLRALATTLLPKVPRTLLNESSRVYFNETREQRFGMPMEQLEREKGGEENWVAARPVVEQIGEFLRAKGGPFILGKEVSYADFYLIGALHFFKRMGEGVYERFVEMAPELGKLYEASKELLVKDD